MDKQLLINKLPRQRRFLALALVFCCFGKAADVPLKNCEVVSVPQQWRIQDVELTHVNRETPTHAKSDDVFELRSSGDKFFLAVKSQYAKTILGLEVYSENKFQFTPGKPTVITSIDDEQWRSAKDDVVSTKDPRQVDPSSQSEVTYEGKQLRFSGEHLSKTNAALPSPDGKFLAFQSFTYAKQDGQIDYDAGTFYVDIFSLPSGVKQFSLSAFIPDIPATPAHRSHWIQSDYFFIDVFSDKQQFILCDATK